MISPWIEKFNISVVANEERPDAPSEGVVYRLVDLFTTRDGCWEPSGKPGATPLWAREKYLRPLGAIDFFCDSGADHHLFGRVLDVNGRPLKAAELVQCWPDGLDKLAEPGYTNYTKLTPKMGSGWAVHHMYDTFIPERGERGAWCWCPRGAADVVMGAGLPNEMHVSYFAVWQAEPCVPEPAISFTAPAATHNGSFAQPQVAPESMPVDALVFALGIATHQQIIDAFYNAANMLGLGDWALLERCGLDVHELARERSARFTDAALSEPSNLNPTERELVHTQLLTQMRLSRQWGGYVRASAGLNLRGGPGTHHELLASLPHETPIDVLDERDAWLCVVTSAGQCGYVHGGYVHRDGGRLSAPTPQTQPAPAQSPSKGSASGYLRMQARLQTTPLSPATPVDITAAMDGAERSLADIWNRYGGLLHAVSAELGVEPDAALAVLAVESNGRAFDENGRMIIRFENHLFFDDWGQENRTRFDEHFQCSAEQRWQGHAWRASVQEPFRPVHVDQNSEWAIFEFARSLNETAAMRSISMGAPQILGRNHALIGYSNVQEMFQHFATEERSQILAFFDFIRAHPPQLQGLRTQDFVSFAASYNGPGQPHYYAELIKQRLQIFRKLPRKPPMAFATPKLAKAPVVQTNGVAPMKPDEATNAQHTQLDEHAFQPFLPPIWAHAADSATEPPSPPTPDAHSEAEPAPSEEMKGASPLQREEPPNGSTPQGIFAHAELMTPEVHAAWNEHIRRGFEKNDEMFNRILQAFLNPYYTTIWMYRIMFGVGILLFLVAVVLSYQTGSAAFGLVFGGMGTTVFLSYFLGKPLRSLEENLQYVTWMGIAYNNYWTRLLYMQESTTIQEDLRRVSQDTIAEIERLIDKSSEISGTRRDA